MRSVFLLKRFHEHSAGRSTGVLWLERNTWENFCQWRVCFWLSTTCRGSVNFGLWVGGIWLGKDQADMNMLLQKHVVSLLAAAAAAAAAPCAPAAPAACYGCCPCCPCCPCCLLPAACRCLLPAACCWLLLLPAAAVSCRCCFLPLLLPAAAACAAGPLLLSSVPFIHLASGKVFFS